MSVVGGEMALPDRIKYVQGKIRIAIQNHQVLWQRLVFHPKDAEVEKMMKMLQNIILSLGRRQTELMCQYNSNLLKKYPNDEETVEKVRMREIGWPDRDEPLRNNVPNGSSADPKKSTAQIVKKHPTMQARLPQKMTSLLKPPNGNPVQSQQRKESERLKAAAAKQAETAGAVITKTVGPGQKPKIVLKVDSRRHREDKPSDSDTFPELKESELAGFKLTPQDVATSVTDLTQDQYLSWFGLIHKDKSKSMVVHQTKRKRRSAAGQSDFYKDYFQPKRPYNRKTVLAETESPCSSQEVAEVETCESSSEKRDVTPSPVSSCSTEVLESPQESSPAMVGRLESPDEEMTGVEQVSVKDDDSLVDRADQTSVVAEGAEAPSIAAAALESVEAVTDPAVHAESNANAADESTPGPGSAELPLAKTPQSKIEATDEASTNSNESSKAVTADANPTDPLPEGATTSSISTVPIAPEQPPETKHDIPSIDCPDSVTNDDSTLSPDLIETDTIKIDIDIPGNVDPVGEESKSSPQGSSPPVVGRLGSPDEEMTGVEQMKVKDDDSLADRADQSSVAEGAEAPSIAATALESVEAVTDPVVHAVSAKDIANAADDSTPGPGSAESPLAKTPQSKVEATDEASTNSNESSKPVTAVANPTDPLPEGATTSSTSTVPIAPELPSESKNDIPSIDSPDSVTNDDSTLSPDLIETDTIKIDIDGPGNVDPVGEESNSVPNEDISAMIGGDLQDDSADGSNCSELVNRYLPSDEDGSEIVCEDGSEVE